MSFGIGIGDIITVSSIAMRICTAIHQATEDQTALLHELEFFSQLVGIIGRRIASSELPQSIERSTEQRLIQCQEILQKLDAITTKYMRPCAALNRYRQIKWGLFKKDQVVKLLHDLRSLISFLDFLLCTYTTQTVQENTAVLQRIENKLPACLDEWAGCHPIYFIDAMERQRVCSFDLCDTWEAFQDFVTFSFKNSAGKSWVAAGKYIISHEQGPSSLIPADEWAANIKPGMTVSMAMVVQQLQISLDSSQECPSCDSYLVITNCHERKRFRCKKCGTWFQLSSKNLVEPAPGTNPSSEAKMPYDYIGPDMLSDLNQLRLFRRWHIQMRYCLLVGSGHNGVPPSCMTKLVDAA